MKNFLKLNYIRNFKFNITQNLQVRDNFKFYLLTIKFFRSPLFSQIVFPKRAAMLLDRLMVALHHALEDDDTKEVQRLSEIYRNGQLPLPPTNKQNVLPKYYKGKTDSDAYYGYKLINGQTGEFCIYQFGCDFFIGVVFHKI